MTAKEKAPEPEKDLEKKEPGPAPQTEGPEPGPEIKRAKLGRGNMRRITKARDDLDNAMVAFVKAMDPLVFVAGEDGTRADRWPLLGQVQDMREYIQREISEVMAQQ